MEGPPLPILPPMERVPGVERVNVLDVCVAPTVTGRLNVLAAVHVFALDRSAAAVPAASYGLVAVKAAEPRVPPAPILSVEPSVPEKVKVLLSVRVFPAAMDRALLAL